MYGEHLQIALSGKEATLGGDQEHAKHALNRYELEYLALSMNNRAAIDSQLSMVLCGLTQLQTRFAEHDDLAPAL